MLITGSIVSEDAGKRFGGLPVLGHLNDVVADRLNLHQADAENLLVGFPLQFVRKFRPQEGGHLGGAAGDEAKIAAHRVRAAVPSLVDAVADVISIGPQIIHDLPLFFQQQIVDILAHQIFDVAPVFPAVDKLFKL